MNFYRQDDPSWADLEYSPGYSFKKFGCLICCLSMFCGKTPPETAQILRNAGLFTDGNINNLAEAGKVLGLEYNGISNNKPPYDTIAMTKYYDKPGTKQIEQHFFILKADGSQIDPLGKSIVYPIVNFRLYKVKENMAGQLYDQGGQVWLSYNNKKFYVEDLPGFPVTDPVIKGDAPGEIMIKKSDQDTRLAQQKAQYEEQIKQLSTELSTSEKLRKDTKQELSACLTDKKDLQDKLDNLPECPSLPPESHQTSFLGKVGQFVLNIFKGVK